MAKLKSLFPMMGTLDDVTFYKSKTGYKTKKKGEVSAAKLADPKFFERRRENGNEFGRAGKAGRVFRKAFGASSVNMAGKGITPRLVKLLVRIVKSDPINPRGQRTLLNGDLSLLKNFEFNDLATFEASFRSPYAVSIDRATGDLGVSIPAFVPMNAVQRPSGATHFRIHTVGASIDFENETDEVVKTSTEAIAVSQVLEGQAINLVSRLGANSPHPLLIAVGIEFYQQVNGVLYPLQDMSYNAMKIAAIDVD